MDNIDNAIRISRKYKGKARLVTLDGQIISQSGSMTGGSLNKNTGILARANEAEKLKEELDHMEKAMEKQEIELKEEDEDDFIPELKDEFYTADDSEIEAEGFTIEDVPEDELGADFGADYDEEDM